MDDNTITVAVISIIIAAGSEVLALLPQTKSNSWIQLLMSGLRSIFPKK